MRMHSVTSVPLPIWGCLNKAEELLGPNRIWHRVRPEQDRFFDNFGSYRNVTSPDLRSWASRVVEEINARLIEEGFTIQLDKSRDPKAIYLLSILRILVHWLIAGEQAMITINQVPYASAVLKDGPRFFTSQGHGHPVAKLQTKEDYSVYMTVLDDQPDEWNLTGIAERIVGNRVCSPDFESFQFPFVDLDIQPDISWLEGMWTESDDEQWIIGQALQQTRLQMNHIGARAESAVAIGMERCMSIQKPRLVIDRPFLTTFVKGGVILFSAFLAEDVWKDPGTIKGL